VPEFVLLSHPGCQLCREMEEAVANHRSAQPIRYRIVDVDSDAALRARYGDTIPVLILDDREICRVRLNRAALDAALADFR
jgi:Glutaredoxin-like domain (DUF836)